MRLSQEILNRGRTMWEFLFLLALPAFFVRFGVLGRHLALRPALFFSYFTGICQDLFIAWGQLGFILLLQAISPTEKWPLLWVCSSIVLQVYLIVDAILYRRTAIRMEVSFFSLLRDAPFFLDSVKEKKVARFIPLALLLLFTPILAYRLFRTSFQQWQFQMGWLFIGILLAFIGSLGHFFLPKKLSYATDQIAFQHILWYIKKFLRFIKRKKDKLDVGYVLRARFQEENEKKSTLSEEYPLLKYTQNFTGERAFTVPVKEGEKPHVIFLFMESFRAKNVGALGAQEGVTPHFDRLAQEGILFTNFYSNSVRTSRSVVSSLFGIPSDVDASEMAARAKTPFLGIPQLLKGEGYHTSYLHNGPIEFEKQDDFFNLHGYDVVQGKNVMAPLFPQATSSSWGLPDECLMRYAVNFLEKRKENPQFLTLFTISNHHPWNLPPNHPSPSFPPHISRIYKRYLKTFHYSDACLGLLVDLLEEKGLLHNTILFALGDHGYPMGEHNNFVEQRYLYEENIRVPLLIYGKGRKIEAKKIPTLASQLDLVPTLMDILGIRGLNLSVGSSLVRKMGERQIFFHNPYVFKNFGCRRGKYKFIYTRISQEVELYNLEQDPDERINIASENEALARELLHGVKDYERLFHSLYADKRIAPEDEIGVSPGSFSLAELD